MDRASVPAGTFTTAGDAQYEYCVAAGTLVLMADGSTKAIEQVRGGDRVLSVDERDPGGLAEPRPVVEVYRNAPNGLLRVYVGGESERHVVRPTPNHRFHVRGKGWVEACELKAATSFDSLTALLGRFEPCATEAKPSRRARIENNAAFVALPLFGFSSKTRL